MQRLIGWIDELLDDRRLRKLGRFDLQYLELALRLDNEPEPRFYLPTRQAEYSSASSCITAGEKRQPVRGGLWQHERRLS